MTDQTESSQLIAPPIFEEDIDQEAQILRWLGKNPNRSLIRRRHNRFEASLFHFDSDLSGATSIDWAGPEPSSLETIQALTTFALNQSDTIQTLIFNFLESPSDEALGSVLTQLKSAGIINRVSQPKSETRSLSAAILEQIQTGPQTLDQLYSFSRTFINSKRPEAAVRQTIRRLLKSQTIQEKISHVYSIA